MTRSALIGVVLFTCSRSMAQTVLPEFGQISNYEINLKECSFDKEAEAIILFDQAETNYDEDYSMITRRRIRIKILNEKGIDKANIRIPVYSGNDFESVSNLEGMTLTAEAFGNIIITNLDKKSIYTEKRDNYFSYIKFAMPAVKAGSIIEYRYLSTMKHFGGLEDWRFQSDLPTIKSSYLLQIPPKLEFTYAVQKKRDYPIMVKPMPDQGEIYFEMNNIPALRFEPYMDAPRDYLQRVLFQLSGIVSVYGSKLDYNTSWRKTAYDLMTDKNFGGQLDKDVKADELKLQVMSKVSATEKLKVVYNYVRDNIAWDGYYGKYSASGVKNVWEKKKGDAGEINLLLIDLLKSFDIESYPLLVAERDFGKIDSTYPFLDRFNKTVALALADGKEFILDATQKNTPAGLTPYPLLNTIAFKVDKKNFALLRIGSGSRVYKSIISVNASLDNKGNLSGKAVLTAFDYAREQWTGALKENKKKFFADNFEKPYEAMAVDSFYALNMENDSLPLSAGINFHQQLNESGGFVFINYNLFTGMAKNPFVSSIRFTNVNFGFPSNIIMEANIRLPAGSKTDELPKDQLLENEDRTIRITREIKLENGQLNVRISFIRNTTLVPADNYIGLKEFYKKMADMLNEPVVLKLEN